MNRKGNERNQKTYERHVMMKKIGKRTREEKNSRNLFFGLHQKRMECPFCIVISFETIDGPNQFVGKEMAASLTPLGLDVAKHIADGLLNHADVEVACKEASRGKGVFAKRGFKKGEDIWIERPLAVAVFPSCQTMSLCCGHCGRFVGPIARFVAHMVGAEDPSVWENPLEMETFPPLEGLPEAVACPTGCKEVFCSQECAEEAIRQYHCLLCMRDDSPGQIFFLQALHVNENFLVTAKIAAGLLLRQESAEETLLKNFSHGLWWDVFSPPEDEVDDEEEECDEGEEEEWMMKTRKQQCQESYFLFRSWVQPKLPAGLSIDALSLADYANIAGMIEQNALESHIPSPLTDYFAKHPHLNSAKTPLMRLVDSELAYSPDDEEFEWPSVTVSVFGSMTSMLNHDCDPNAILLSPAPNACSHLAAQEDITAGEEITISYIDDDIDDHHVRNAHLAKPYLFKCSCERCQKGRAGFLDKA